MRFVLIVIGVAITSTTFCQESGWSYFVGANTNIFLPDDASNKQLHPTVGYYKDDANRKLRIGGVGVGFSAFRSLQERLDFKAQLNLSKHTYWDEPFDLRDMNNAPLGGFVMANSDLAAGLTGTVHYFISKKFSAGTGIGAQLFTTAVSKPKAGNAAFVRDAVFVTRYYKPFLPVVPVELSLKGKKMLYNVRYEYPLSDRYKPELSEYRTDRSGLLYFEVAYRIH